MAQLTPKFSADRTVREYTENFYLPAAIQFLDRADNKGNKGKQYYDTILSLEQKWDTIHFGEVKVSTNENKHYFEIQVYFNEVNPDNVQVELVVNGLNGDAPVVQVMDRGSNLEDQSNAFQFHVAVPATRMTSEFTARVIPFIPSVSVPLEISKITWQH
jgi:starch phosphorylase